MGATLLEDIQELGKLTHLLQSFSMSPQKRVNEAQIGFGVQKNASGYEHHDQIKAKTIAAGATKRVFMKLNIS